MSTLLIAQSSIKQLSPRHWTLTARWCRKRSQRPIDLKNQKINGHDSPYAARRMTALAKRIKHLGHIPDNQTTWTKVIEEKCRMLPRRSNIADALPIIVSRF